MLTASPWRWLQVFCFLIAAAVVPLRQQGAINTTEKESLNETAMRKSFIFVSECEQWSSQGQRPPDLMKGSWRGLEAHAETETKPSAVTQKSANVTTLFCLYERKKNVEEDHTTWDVSLKLYRGWRSGSTDTSETHIVCSSSKEPQHGFKMFSIDLKISTVSWKK